MTTGGLARIRLLAGLLLAGQGLLVVTRVLDHEAPLLVGWGILLLGLVLALWGRAPFLSFKPGRTTPTRDAGPPEAAAPRAPTPRSAVVAGLGAFATLGVMAYNVLTRSDLSMPEVAILAYGVVLLLASRALDRPVWRTRVGTLVAYSFPLVLAPLALYAVNAATRSQLGAAPLGWYIHYTLVEPMALLLATAGMDASLLGDTVRISTPRGPLFLTVGVVCAGLYAAVLFLGVFALFAWESRTPAPRLALSLAVGLLGLHVANLLRLALLGWVGYRWGGGALQTFHQHAGWVLFLAWSVLFWAVVLRRFEGGGRVAAP